MTIEQLAKRIEILEKQISILMEIKSQTIIISYKEWIESFSNNNNPGTSYEICVGLSILYGSQVCKNEPLPLTYQHIKPCNKFKNIKGIINLTQNDNIGGTGDIAIVFNDNTIKYYSVTQWKNKLSKCIFNPSGEKYYGVTRNVETEQKNDEAYEMAIKYRKKNNKWKRVSGCPGSKYMCEFLADKGSNNWNENERSERKETLEKFIDLCCGINTNTNGIIYWDSKKNSIANIYKWTFNVNLDNYLKTFSHGIYIYHGNSLEDYILRTQVKYNNGIIEGMSSKKQQSEWVISKSKNYLSSWNCQAVDLNKIFKLELL